jgi:ribosome maturation factor RimP
METLSSGWMPSTVLLFMKLPVETVQVIEAAWSELAQKTVGDEFFVLEACFEREGSQWYLRLFLDRPNNGDITLEDCTRVTRLLDPLVDALPIPDKISYHLEISSPGLFRQLKTERELQFYQGRSVRVEADGQAWEADLEQFENGILHLSGGVSVAFHPVTTKVTLNPTIKES